MLAQQFTSDTQKLVIAPVEKMVNIIKQLAVDPLKKPEVTPSRVLNVVVHSTNIY